MRVLQTTTTDAREHYLFGPPTLCVSRPVITDSIRSVFNQTRE